MLKTALYLFASVALLAALALRAPTVPVSATDRDTFDVVISGGRVMDPESGLDAIRNVGIRDGKIVEISKKALQGKQNIDADGLVVAPGFIDLHEHGQEPRNYQFQAYDGVTTSLELELGTDDVSSWYAQREGKSLINFGVSAGHIPIRMRVMNDPGKWLPTGAAAHKAASPEQLRAIQQGIEAGLKAGALAVGMGINYTEAASHPEIVEMFRVAAKYQAPVHVHVRFAGAGEPSTGLAAVEEVLAAAVSTGAPLHVVHITSIGLAQTPQLIHLIEDAQRHRLDVTTECYPYVAASTGLESALFDPGWQERMGITFKDIQWAKTGERLTAETFEKYRAEGGAVVIYAIPESASRAAVSNSIVMIASDGMPITGAKVHPRGQGTFSRVLGHYVREEKALDLMTALRKMTLLPAQRLEKRAPAFRNKGRIRVGADADITVFDSVRIVDKATFDEPLQYSEGISFLLVNGVPVIKDGKLVEGVFPGRPARASIQQ
jgi:cytosine/adenosine deaminase-related metal-dependent hydrolase